MRIEKTRNIIDSFKYAIKGFSYVFRNERNLRIHMSAGLLALVLGYWLHLSTTEYIILVMTIFLVIICELINTAIEYTVDATVKEYNVIAGLAKDIGATVPLLSSVLSVIVGLVLFLRQGRIMIILDSPYYILIILIYILLAIPFIFLIKPIKGEDVLDKRKF